MKLETPPAGSPLQLPGMMQNVNKLKPANQPLIEDVDAMIAPPRTERKNKLAKQPVRPKRAAFAIGHQAFNKGNDAFT